MNVTQYTNDNLKEFARRLGWPVLNDCSDEELHNHVRLLCIEHLMDADTFYSCMGEIVCGDPASAFDVVIQKQYTVLSAIRNALVPARINYDSATGKPLTIVQSADRIVSELVDLRRHNEQLRQRLTVLAVHGDK